MPRLNLFAYSWSAVVVQAAVVPRMPLALLFQAVQAAVVGRLLIYSLLPVNSATPKHIPLVPQ